MRRQCTTPPIQTPRPIIVRYARAAAAACSLSRSLRPAPHRAVPRPPAPASEPQPHETRYYFAAPSPRRSTPFSTSRHYYPSDCELSCDTTGGSQIKMPSAAAPTNSRPPAPICSQRRRPTPLPPKPLPNQIPRDREPLTSPADSFFGGFRTPALATAVQIDDRPASETLHESGRWYASRSAESQTRMASRSATVPRLTREVPN